MTTDNHDQHNPRSVGSIGSSSSAEAAQQQHDNVMELIGASVPSWIEQQNMKQGQQEQCNNNNPNQNKALDHSNTTSSTTANSPPPVVDVDSLSTVDENEEITPLSQHSQQHLRNSSVVTTDSTTASTAQSSEAGAPVLTNNNRNNSSSSLRRSLSANNPFRKSQTTIHTVHMDHVKKAMSIAHSETHKRHNKNKTNNHHHRASVVLSRLTGGSTDFQAIATIADDENDENDDDNSDEERPPDEKDDHRPSLKEIEESNDNHSARYRYDESISQTKSRAIQELRHMASGAGHSVEDQEIQVRHVHDGGCGDTWDSIFSSLKVIFVFLLTKETYATMVLAVGSTVYFYLIHKDEDEWDGGGVPFVLLGVAVVIPTMNLIAMEFGRREDALRRLGELRGVWLRIYQLHALMNWGGGSGRGNQKETDEYYLGLGHLDDVGDNILGACDELMRFLTLPSSTETHNLLTLKGQMRATHILSVGEALFESCTARRGARFTILAERLKAAGASQTEMSRMEQFTKDMQAQYEHLRFIKMYRTPQALRSLARVTTIMMLPLFGPSYAYLAMNVGSLFYGLMLTMISALILSGLYEAARVVEDPFTAFVVMDGINVREEQDTLYRQLCAIREEAFGPEARTNPYEIPPSHCLTLDNQLEGPGCLSRAFASRSSKKIDENDRRGHDTQSLIEKSSFRRQPKAKMVPRRRLMEAFRAAKTSGALNSSSDSVTSLPKS